MLHDTTIKITGMEVEPFHKGFKLRHLLKFTSAKGHDFYLVLAKQNDAQRFATLLNKRVRIKYGVYEARNVVREIW